MSTLTIAKHTIPWPYHTQSDEWTAPPSPCRTSHPANPDCGVHISPTPAPSTPVTCIQYFRNLIKMTLLSINPLVIGSFHLIPGPQGSSILYHMSKSSSLLKAV